MGLLERPVSSSDYLTAREMDFSKIGEMKANEPAYSFYNAVLKVRWANFLIRQAEANWAAWHDIVPFSISTTFSPISRSTELTFQAASSVPWQLHSLLADVCHNLRSPLDYCWMGLVRKVRPGTEERSNFPNGPDRDRVVQLIKNAKLGELEDRAINLIADDLRPHRDVDAGGSAAFQALNGLSNWQKHNLLPLTQGHVDLIATAHRKGAGPVTLPPFRIGVGKSRSVSVEGEVVKVGSSRTFFHGISGFDYIDPETPLLQALRDLSDFSLSWVLKFADTFPEGLNIDLRYAAGPGHREVGDNYRRPQQI